MLSACARVQNAQQSGQPGSGLLARVSSPAGLPQTRPEPPPGAEPGASLSFRFRLQPSFSDLQFFPVPFEEFKLQVS